VKSDKENNSSRLKYLKKLIKSILGFSPQNLYLYYLAITPRFVEATFNGERISNERLEFLGDAVLDLIVAQYLFHKFPHKDEGFLTEIRSRIVNTENLCKIAKETNLIEIVEKFLPTQHKTPPNNWLGNTLESFIGAIFLDKGYDFCYKFFISLIKDKIIDIEKIISEENNYKSRLLEYCQKNKLNLEFFSEKLQNNNFKIKILINNKLISEYIAPNIKRAEKEASKIAYDKLINKKATIYVL
jgi:ribonuclease-3